MARILLGVTGSIAAYKSCDLASQLIKRGHEVRVIMTDSAKQFISPLSLETISRNPVYIDQFAAQNQATEHIALARWADITCVAPATASFICKYSAGIADNLLVTELLACQHSVVIAPAMNHAMLASFQVKNAIELLQQNGVHLIPPQTGELACGEWGAGKMAAVETVIEHIEQILVQPTPLANEHILLTAGPTRNYLDPIRFISNPASGRMGIALAETAESLGATVTLVLGPTEAEHRNRHTISVETTVQMADAVAAELSRCTAFIATAAVADLQPTNVSDQKIKKSPTTKPIEFKPSIDILDTVSKSDSRPKLVVGFAAETNHLIENARNKLQTKQLDFIVANQVGLENQGMGSLNNSCTVIDTNGKQTTFGRTNKDHLARQILEVIYADRFKLAAATRHPEVISV